MNETTTDLIKVGDHVVYRTTDGEFLGDAPGKVLGIFRTMDGKTLVDVEWDRLGMPKRISIERLARFTSNGR